MKLTYIPPQVVNGEIRVQYKEEVDRKTEKWKGALIAYVLGDLPGYNVMKRYIENTWNSIPDPELYMHEDGYYIIKFKSMEDMREILLAGPYTINNRQIILKQWIADFDFEKEFPTEIPLWIRFPKLPLNCWGVNSLSRIASSIGTPMYADECTAKQLRVSYARMLIEVDMTKPLKDEIIVEDSNGKTFLQSVIYDWKPKFCEKCQIIGHDCKQERGRQIQMNTKNEQRKPKKVVQHWVKRRKGR
ncbi:PREDICTED: uncharacterized protein LOC109227676 [Nicotiana attenuata]|uniref:uncharacterized protein LOC109222020 n=1 Tax=Nicotiana attenuata TaxID=49451 RepID=UPI000904C8F8|nr:PREDICTED: uncharacterized protein LOC109222020 [Nicotiana attenuata]XP_019248420.1 PREDICTED: uncharacterized protein LOC109227676 [Nicotiana attenuata]